MRDARALHVAVVHTVDAVRLITAATSRAVLADQLDEYVQQQADDRLWPDDARCLHRLLATEERDAAIALYFASVGERWDDEWLVIDDVEVRPSACEGATPEHDRH